MISRLDAKRLIGRKFEDSTVQSDMKHWPFDVISDGGKPKIQVDFKGEQKTFFPEEISSMVLVKMKETAEAYLGKVCLTIYLHINGKFEKFMKSTTKTFCSCIQLIFSSTFLVLCNIGFLVSKEKN
jgi:L1 cell adhesion molecule like protein